MACLESCGKIKKKYNHFPNLCISFGVDKACKRAVYLFPTLHVTFNLSPFLGNIHFFLHVVNKDPTSSPSVSENQKSIEY